MFSGELFFAACVAVMPSLTSSPSGQEAQEEVGRGEDSRLVMAMSIKDEDRNIDLAAIADSEFSSLSLHPSSHPFINLPLLQRHFTLDLIIDQYRETERTRLLKIKSSNVSTN